MDIDKKLREVTTIKHDLLKALGNSHYEPKVYPTDNGYVTVTGAITGCGLAQMYNVTGLVCLFRRDEKRLLIF